MKTKSPLFAWVLAWLVGGWILLLYLGVHATFLLIDMIERGRPKNWDWLFLLLFVTLVVLTFRSLVRRLRGVRRAGAGFRVVLGVSAVLGILTPVSMFLGLFRVHLHNPDAWIEPILFFFMMLGSLVGAVVCFFLRYLFRPHTVISSAPPEGETPKHPGPPNLARPPTYPPRRPRETDTYALLQIALDQPLPLEALKEASHAVPSICEADCVRMSREAYGIVAANLSEPDARAFQIALRGRGIETLLVRQDQVFPLPPGRVTRDLSLEGDELVETDSFGRSLRIQPDQCALVAAGRIRDRVRSQETKEIKEKRLHSFGRNVPVVSTYTTKVKKDVWETATYHRIDLLLLQEPYRLTWQCDPTRPTRLDNEVVRADDEEPIQAFMAKLANWLPSQRLNQGLKRLSETDPFTYPSRSAFEEEIVWRLTKVDSD